MQTAGPAGVAILEDPSLEVDVGCEIATEDGWEDISEDLEPSGDVTYRMGATYQRTAKVSLSRQLEWTTARIRLRMSVTGSVGTVDVPLGVFVTSTPTDVAGESPKTWDVECYDLLWLLDDLMGSTFVAQGGGYLENVRTLVEAAGLPLVLTDETSDRTIVTPRVFSFDEDWTRLAVVNQLLAAVGFRPLWIDGEGRARSEPIVPVADRPAEWVYDVGPDTTIADGASRTLDNFEIPNRLVAVSDDPEVPLTPVTLTVADGRPVRTAKLRVEAADQAALAALAAEEFARLRRVEELVELSVSPNPLHEHRDVVRIVQPELGVDGRALVEAWTLPLDGSDMSLTCRMLP